MKAAHQDALLQHVQDVIKEQAVIQNKKLETYSLTQLLLDANTPENLATNKSFYLDIFNLAGSPDNFEGPFLVSEWYRRNLYMYSLVQKTMTAQDHKAMIVVGSGHAAMMQEFIKSGHQFWLKSLQDVLK